MIFISISTEITSPFQWHSWISKLRPGSSIPLQIMHMHHIPHPAYHIMFMCWLFTMLCASFRCLLLRVGSDIVAFVRTRSTTSVCLLHGLVLLPCGISGKMTIPSKSLLSLLASCSLFCYAYAAIPTTCLSCLPYCWAKPLTHLVLANRCLAMLPLCSAPLIALLVAGEVEVCSMLEHGYVGISQYLLFN